MAASVQQLRSSCSTPHPSSNRRLEAKLHGSSFTVGAASSAASSNVDFYSDRAEYFFHHADLGRVHMVMYFRDITEWKVTKQGLMRFRVRGPLLQFGSQYDETNPDHSLSMKLGGAGAVQVQRVRQLLQERVPGCP
jgi:hypothetical protein